METKMKGKGKAIVGIAMAAIILASVFAAMVPTGTAQAGDMREIDSYDAGPFTVIIGEKLRIHNLTAGQTVSFVSTDPDDAFSWTADDEGNITQDITSAKVEETGYKMTFDSTERHIYFNEPTLSIEIQNMDEESITSTTIGKDIRLKVDTNLPDKDVVVLKVKRESAETLITENLSVVKGYTIDTSGWDVGDYEIWLELKESESMGLSKTECPCTADTITMNEPEITIEAAKTEPVKFEEVTFTINGPPGEYFNFSVSKDKAKYVWMTRKEKNPLVLPETVAAVAMDNTTYVPAGNEGKFKAKTDENGVYKFVAYFTDDKKFKFKVWLGPSLDDASSKQKDDIDIDVSEQKIVFEIDRTVIRGEEVTIKGTAPEADWVVIAVDDEVIEDGGDATVTDGEFEIDWDTTTYITGTYTIEGFINLEGYAEGDDTSDESSDGHISIKVISKGLTVEQPRNVVAIKDDYTVKGTATGVDDVDILIIGPKGCTGGDCLSDDVNRAVKSGFAHITGSVTDNEYEEDIEILEDSKTGMYTVLVLIPGDDGDWGAGAYGDYGEGDLGTLLKAQIGNVKGKNLGQLISLVGSYTFDDTATDDVYEPLTFSTESAYVRFNPVEGVGVGELLNVSGVTNRYDLSITVSTLSGPVDLPAEIEDVEWPTAEEGVFTATIDTTDAVEGTYVLEADDGDDNTDTVTVTIGPVTPTPTPTAEPTAAPTATPTPVPTAEPTAEPAAEPTATPEEPGFEAVFAIAGLLSIAYLVLRRRK